MNEIQRLQQLAGILVQESEEEVTKTAIGHKDNEVQMLQQDLYLLGKSAVELHKMLNGMDSTADFPHWWQSKIVKAKDYIEAAKNYLDSVQNIPSDEEPHVSDDVQDIDPSGV